MATRKFLVDIDMATGKVTNLGTPTATTDAATKAYVDNAIAGIESKLPVRVATTAAGTLATSFANGQTVDGVALVTGDRILIKNQAAAAENGIYTVNASGAPTRATDFDSSAEIVSSLVPVGHEGTANKDTVWLTTVTGPITVGTTAINFSQFGASTAYTAGTGIGIAGTVVSIDHAVVPEKYETDVGDGASTSLVVTHSLGTKAVQVAVYDNTTPFAEVYPEVRHTSTTTVTLVFSVAPTSNQYHTVVFG